MSKVGNPAAVLFAPKEYWNLTQADRQDLCNGCGTKGLCGFLVPDSIHGLRITPACNIHDFMYSIGETIEDKHEADRVFLNNLLRLVEAGTSWTWLKKLRAIRCHEYFLAVDKFGGPAFWNGKNEPGTEESVLASK